MTFLNISKKSVKVDALNGICKYITYKLRKADVMRGSFSILLNIVIFFLIFVCLVIKKIVSCVFTYNCHCGLVEQWYLFHIYCCHQHMKWCCWFVHVLHVFLLAGKLEMIGQVTHSPFHLILLFELESTNCHNHLDVEYI